MVFTIGDVYFKATPSGWRNLICGNTFTPQNDKIHVFYKTTNIHDFYFPNMSQSLYIYYFLTRVQTNLVQFPP